VNDYFWVDHWNNIDLSICKLTLEHWSLFEANTDLHLVSKYMLLACWQSFSLFFDHSLKINIYFNALQLIVCLSLTLKLAYFFHAHSPCISIEFDLIDLVSSRYSPLLRWLSLICNSRSSKLLGHLSNIRSDTILLFESILSLLGRAVSRQPFIFEFIEHLFWTHGINLRLLLIILHFGLLLDSH